MEQTNLAEAEHGSKKRRARRRETSFWPAIGAIATILTLVVTVAQDLLRQDEEPLSEVLLLESLPRNAPESVLIVGSGETYRVETGEWNFRAAQFGRGSTVEVTGEGPWTLRALSLVFYDDVKIVAIGKSGADGKAGPNGRNGRADCVPGDKGGNGTEGMSGSPGINISLWAKNLLLLSESVQIDTSGGDGGDGGPGGNGGNGGKADRSEACKGGDGGRGGSGGPPGVGGAGGNLLVRYLTASSDIGVPIDPNTVRARFTHISKPGVSGKPGARGKGGDGGAARGAVFLGAGAQPAGARGGVGDPGSSVQTTAASGNTDIGPVTHDAG